MLMRMIAALAGWMVLTAAQAPQPAPAQAELSLWRLDCGEFVIKQYGAFFSDTFQYPAGPKDIVGSCYLIRHGSRYMLWDTGLTDAQWLEYAAFLLVGALIMAASIASASYVTGIPRG